ncbi:MAG: LysR substrate-binding domain-containing protein, partial [Sphingobium sp.]
RRLVKEELDFGFTLFVPGFRDPRLVYETLFVLPCSTYASPGHPLAGAKRVSVERLAEQEWALSGSAALRSTFTSFFTNRGLLPPARLVQASSIALLVSLVSRHNFLTVLPDAVAQAPLLAGRLMRIDAAETPASDPDGGLVYRPDIIRTPAVTMLMGMFRELTARLADARR